MGARPAQGAGVRASPARHILCVLAPGSRLDEQELAGRLRRGSGRGEGGVGPPRSGGSGGASRPPPGTNGGVPRPAGSPPGRGRPSPDRAALRCPGRRRNAGPEDIHRLRSAFAGAEEAVRARDAIRPGAHGTQQFHEAIARASGNVTLARILIPLQDKAARFWVWSMARTARRVLLGQIARHRAVVDAIADRDPERAAKRRPLHLGRLLRRTPTGALNAPAGRPGDRARGFHPRSS